MCLVLVGMRTHLLPIGARFGVTRFGMTTALRLLLLIGLIVDGTSDEASEVDFEASCKRATT